MKIELVNGYGKIKIDEQIFGQIAKRAIDKADGNAWLATKRGKIIEDGFFQSKPDYSPSIECDFHDGVMDCNVHIICRFGKSIRQTSKIIIDSVKKDLAKICKVGEVKVSVMGMLSKRLAKRKMEIKE